MRVALLGNGSLSKAFVSQTKHQVTIYSKPDINFLNPDTLNFYIKDIACHDVVLNTIGTYKGTTSEIFQINFLTPVLLIQKLIEFNYTGKILMIGSHGSTWPSWPGIDNERLNYNTSKMSLRNYLINLSHSNLTKMHLCLVDTCKFYSQMSNYTGGPVEDVAQILENIIDSNSPRILHIETY